MRQSLLSCCLVLALAACEETPEPKVAPAPPPPPPEKIDTGPTAMESEIGGLNDEAVEKAFSSLNLEGCVGRGVQKVEQLGGNLKLKIRIDRKGHARWVYLSESTLGDRDTEKCLLDLARAKTWPKPLGGEGMAEKNYEVEPRVKPFRMDEKRLVTPIARARSEAAKCRRGVTGSFSATVYLKPSGAVVAAGLAVPSDKGEAVADCMVEALRKVRFHAGMPKASKLSFAIP